MNPERSGISLAFDYVAAVTTPGAYISAVIGAVVYALVPEVTLAVAMVGMLGLWGLDFALGILTAWVNRVPISGRRMGEGLVKLMAYFALPTALAIMKLVAGGQGAEYWKFAQWIVVFACAGRELWSVIEKCDGLGAKLPPRLIRAMKGRWKAELDELAGEETKTE